MATISASVPTPAAAGTASRGEVGGLLVVGNPLLDIVASVDADFLKHYKLNPGDGVLQTADQEGIYERIAQDFNHTYLPGGSALNSARAYQAMCFKPKSTTYLGAVGQDEAGKLLEELASQEGVDMRLQKVPGEPTGMCAVLVHNKERTLCTNLGASAKLAYTEDIDGLPAGTNVCYMTTYVLQSSKEVVFQLARQCAEASKVVGLNLSSPFSASTNRHSIKELLPDVNIVFGNVEEYKELVTGLGLIDPYDGSSDKDDYERRLCEVVLGLMMAPETHTAATTPGSMGASQKVIKAAVMTRQKHPVYIAEACAGGEVSFQQVHVPPVPEHEIVDLNGAGDAFVGGFFAAFEKGHSLREAALLGSLAAGQIIRCEGFCMELTCLRDLMNSDRYCEDVPLS